MAFSSHRAVGLMAAVLLLMSCKDGSSGKMSSLPKEGSQGSGSTGVGKVRAIRGQLDFELGAVGTTAVVPNQAGTPSSQSPGSPAKITLSSSVAGGAPGVSGGATVRMEFVISLDKTVQQLEELGAYDEGQAFLRIGTFSTSNIIHEPRNERLVAEETARALYRVYSKDCLGTCVRFITGGSSLRDSKDDTILLEFQETGGRWVLARFRYYGLGTVTDYGMPIEVVLTDRFDG